MELIERVLQNLKERREKILKGEVNCIPSPFNRFRSEFAGIEQGRYYLVSGGTKSGKTQFTSYLFVYNSILYSYYNPTKVKTTIFYYPLEETAEEIMLRFMSFLLNKLSKGTIHISPEDLKSTREDKPVPEEILNLLESDEYNLILNHFQECLHIQDSRNPTGVWKDLNSYALANGAVVKRKYQIKDSFEEKEAFDYYIPNNPNEYVIIIFDHASLLETERGMSLRESICKLSEYFVVLRNRYNFIPVIVQQQSTETLDLEAFKNNKIRPTVSGLADGKYTARDASVFLGITNPFSHELPSYLGYNIQQLRDHARFVEVVLNRHGKSNGICPLFFDGATCTFKELPLPEDKVNMQKVYDFIKNGCVEKTNAFIHFIYTSIKHLIK